MIVSKLYSFEELMLWNFIQCLIKSDFKHLKKSKGFIKQSKLKKHWDLIFSEYLERSGDDSQIFLLSALKEYSILSNKIRLIDMSLEQLSHGWNDIIAKNMADVGFPVKNHEDPEKYMKGLKSVQSRAKMLVMRANKLKADIDGFKDNAGSKEIKESDFNEILLIMSKNQGYSITSKNTTVVDFISLTKIYQDNGK